jgi:hypothetical protein
MTPSRYPNGTISVPLWYHFGAILAHRLKKRTTALIALLIGIGFLSLWRWRPQEKTNPHSNSPDIEELRALPYAQWTRISEGERRKLGVTVFDEQRAWHGYNLYTNDVDTAFLMDMSGKKLHTWRFQKNKKCEYAHLLPTGEILGVCMGQGVWKVDWDSRVIWKRRYFVHHDIEPLPDGSFWTTRREKNIEYRGRFVVFDALQRISANGKLLEKWYTFDHLEELQQWHKPLSLDSAATTKSNTKYDYYHLNTVKLLPDNPYAKSDRRFRKGNLLICLRNASLIAILDQDTKKVVWGYGPDELEWPHMPVMLPTGNILIFDNGVRRKFSRVVEINPLTKEVVWSYGGPKKNFFSALQGSAQRLPNGNTLICESDKGHVFEIDSSGNIVWEFWNPEMKENSRKTIYRFTRLPIESVPAGRLQSSK